MSKEMRGVIPAILTTKEEVHEVVFSPKAKEKYEQQYPHLGKSDIQKVLDEMEEVTEGAKVLNFIPALVGSSLEELSRDKKDEL